MRRSLGIHYAGEETLQQAYFGGRMFASYLRAPTLYRDVLKHRAAFQHWAINPDIRTTIIALNGTDEFLFWMKPKDPQAAPQDDVVRRAVAACCGRDVPVTLRLRTRPGPRAWRWWPNGSPTAASCWPGMRYICLRRPAALA